MLKSSDTKVLGYCFKCHWHQQDGRQQSVCAVEDIRDPVSGALDLPFCKHERAIGGECGPRGSFFKEKLKEK